MITNCAPLVVETDFNSSFQSASSSIKSDITILTKSYRNTLTEVKQCRGKAGTELLTLTPDAHIFKMTTVVNTNPSILAVIQSGFIASTHYIVQPNESSSLAKELKGNCCCSCEKSDYQISTCTANVSLIFRAYPLKRIPVVCRLHQH